MFLRAVVQETTAKTGPWTVRRGSGRGEEGEEEEKKGWHTWGTFHVSAAARRVARSMKLRPIEPSKAILPGFASRELSLLMFRAEAVRARLRVSLGSPLTRRGESWRRLRG